MNKNIHLLCFNFINLFLILTLGLSSIFKSDSPKYATVEISKIVELHLKKISESNSLDKISVQKSKFSKKLINAIRHIERKHKVILLVRPAVVSNLPDYTSEINSLIRTQI